MGPHCSQKHIIVVEKLTNIVSSHPYEGTIRVNRPCCKQTNTVSDKTEMRNERLNYVKNIAQ